MKPIYVTLAAAVLLFIICMQQCSISRMKIDSAMKDVNINALTDTIQKTKNKLGNEQYEKSVLITSKRGLEDLNNELYKEVKAQKGKIAFLEKAIITISSEHSAITIIPVHTGGNPCDSIAYYELPWRSDAQFDANNSRKLAGNTKFMIKKGTLSDATSVVTEDEIMFDIITGLEKKDDHYEIFIRSNYPGFKPSKIDGAFIPQKDLFPPQAKKRWVFGPTFNVGIGVGGMQINALGPVIYAGVGLGITQKWISF